MKNKLLGKNARLVLGIIFGEFILELDFSQPLVDRYYKYFYILNIIFIIVQEDTK